MLQTDDPEKITSRTGALTTNQHRPSGKWSLFHASFNAVLSKPLLPAIVVMNKSYFPQEDGCAATVGASAFTMSVVEALMDMSVFCGMILYRRDTSILEPTVFLATMNSITCATVSFSFTMDATKVKKVMELAVDILKDSSQDTPMLYYQTDTLLEYHPSHFPFCVTHHGPLYDHLSTTFSKSSASFAFGSRDKAEHLARKQQAGMESLKHSANGYVLLHSRLQSSVLLNCGINQGQMRMICPPIRLAPLASYSYRVDEIIPTKMADALKFPGITMFTTVARIDYFKNIELLVDASLILLSQDVPVRVVIAGDTADSTSHRELWKRIPARFMRCFIIEPKLSKSSLYALFRIAKENGIFVCPSRYETLGITPLEAALSGVPTLISESNCVEASRYFPKELRFPATGHELATAVMKVHAQGLGKAGEMLRHHVAARISEWRFRSDLHDAWGDFSLRFLTSQDI